MRLFKTKKAASEMFHLFVPILLFMVVCLIFIVIFSFIQQSFTGRTMTNWKSHNLYDADDFTLSSGPNRSYADAVSVLKTTVLCKSKVSPTDASYYRFSIYEIFYEGIYQECKDSINNAIDNYIITYSSNEICNSPYACSSSNNCFTTGNLNSMNDKYNYVWLVNSQKIQMKNKCLGIYKYGSRLRTASEQSDYEINEAFAASTPP